MTLEQFEQIIKPLQANFSKDPDWKMIKEQTRMWHERFTACFPTRDAYFLVRAINFAIDNCERYPSWAEFKKLAGEIKEVKPLITQAECSFCFGVGTVVGIKDLYQCCFRCPKCEGPETSKFIPLWSSYKEKDGFTLSKIFKKEDIFLTEI